MCFRVGISRVGFLLGPKDDFVSGRLVLECLGFFIIESWVVFRAGWICLRKGVSCGWRFVRYVLGGFFYRMGESRIS